MAQRRQIIEKKDCFFCKEKKTPDFLEIEMLEHYMSDRGKIYPRSRSGLCSKHQRRFSSQVKRARYIALLPYIVRPE